MTTKNTYHVETTSTKDSWHNKEPSSLDLSDLARIEINSEDPLDLFKEWHEEAKKYSTGMPNALCLATVSKGLKVSARHVILRHYDQQGFVVVTDSRSRKSSDLEDVPIAAMCILWAYPNDQHHNISRQVRIEGNIEKLSPEEFRHLYEREPRYCKIRSHLCCQGKEVNWDEQKLCHDKIMREVCAGKRDLPMPDHFVAYRLVPDSMEYYYAYDHFIADRLLFKKESETWTYRRIAA